MKKNLFEVSCLAELEAAGIEKKDAAKVFAHLEACGSNNFLALANLGLTWDTMRILGREWYIRSGKPMVNINETSPLVLGNVFSHREVNRLSKYWKCGGKKFRTPLDMVGAGIARDRIMSLIDSKKLGVVINVKADEDSAVTEININCGIISELTKLNGIGAVYAVKIVNHGRINDLAELDEILGRKGISKKVVEGDYRAVVLEAAEKPSFRAQLSSVLHNGNHKLDNGIRSRLMQKADKGKATVQMQSLTFIQANNELGMECIVDITAAPVTAFTAPYAKQDVVLGNSIGRNQFSGQRLATDKVATVDFSDLVRADETSGKKVQEKAARALKYLLGKIDGVKEGGKIYITKGLGLEVDMDGENVSYKPVYKDGVSVLVELKNCYAILSGHNPADRMKDHHLTAFKKEWLKPEDIIMVLDAKRCNIYSTSQKRQDTMMFFDATTEESVEKFNKIFHEATHGEYAIRKGEKVTGTMLVDAATRLSSHTCGMGARADQGFTLKSFAILFEKDDQMDGEGLMTNTCVARAIQELK